MTRWRPWLPARWFICVLVLLMAVNQGGAEPPVERDQTARTRSFRLDYHCTVVGLRPDATVRVWQPVPQSTAEQRIDVLTTELPGPGSLATEPKYGNRILYFDVTAPETGELSMRRTYRVERQEVLGMAGQARPQPPLSESRRNLFLSANQRVPVSGRPLKLLETLTLPDETLELAELLYQRVDNHVRYDKSRPGYGEGDVLWVCDSQFGNCTDFHSLFISLARSQGIPSRFEIGFPLPPERGSGSIGGYHCWAWFHTQERGWLPVDISEADKHPELKAYYFGNLTENRVTFSVGRDIQLVPAQRGAPLNYFVYPHVEVDGRPHPQAKLQLTVRFEDER